MLCGCEAVINDRPLTYIEGDNTDSLEPLRPSCFLQAIPQSQVTDLDNIDATSLNRRLRYLQRLRNDFRQRFKSEFLIELVQKGKQEDQGLKVGDIVLVESEAKRVKWPLGRLIEIYRGKDRVDRTAKTITSVGCKTRPFQRLYKLKLSFSGAEGGTEEIKGTREAQVDNKTSLGNKFSIVLYPSSTIIKKRVAVDKEAPEKTTRLGRTIRLPSKFKI
ncbi:unnamed protein product [Parnassius mnemosyne]|uniref:DUF5641 domain-containing protein n=1 Tax=Parnassius mnemosyne TaxID=213953 RepID=A0AAV1LM16_9NEOP